jgi:hypothetical protein
VAAKLIEQDGTSAETGREEWQAPIVTRFGAAGAGAGDTVFNSADGDTAKS